MSARSVPLVTVSRYGSDISVRLKVLRPFWLVWIILPSDTAYPQHLLATGIS